jgi:hypothetical protein
MKFTISFCSLVLLSIFCTLLNAQTEGDIRTAGSIASTGRDQLRPQLKLSDVDSIHWLFGGDATANLRYTSLTNWAAGGEDHISTNGVLNMFYNYRRDKRTLENYLSMAYGFSKTGENAAIKSDDRLHFMSKVGHRITPTLFYTASFLARSQFSASYRYNQNDTTMISNFWAPMHMYLSVGIEWRPKPNFSLNVSPLMGRATYVSNIPDRKLMRSYHSDLLRDRQKPIEPLPGSDQDAFDKWDVDMKEWEKHVAERPGNLERRLLENQVLIRSSAGIRREKVQEIDGSGNPVYEPNGQPKMVNEHDTAYIRRNSRYDFGGGIVMRLNGNIFQNRISYDTTLDLFSNYMDDPENISVYWTFNSKILIYKNISADLRLELKYDDKQKSIRETKDDRGNVTSREPGPPQVQTRLFYGIGLFYQF